MAGKTTKKGKSEDASKPEEASAPKPKTEDPKSDGSDELPIEQLVPELLARIERLEHHTRLGPPPEISGPLEVRTVGRGRHVCGAGTFTREWKRIHPATKSEAEALKAEEKAGILEVRRAS